MSHLISNKSLEACTKEPCCILYVVRSTARNPNWNVNLSRGNFDVIKSLKKARPIRPAAQSLAQAKTSRNH